MRREGHQHGMVCTYPILSSPWPKPRNLNELSSPPTAGLFHKVSTKPTSHSKFTGKCGRAMCRDCHFHPASKSKDKVKGKHKIRSLSQSGLITWRVVDSATGMLDYLAGDDVMCRDRNVDKTYDNNVSSEIDDSEVSGVDSAEQMSFYEVGEVWHPVDEDEDWCLVEEM